MSGARLGRRPRAGHARLDERAVLEGCCATRSASTASLTDSQGMGPINGPVGSAEGAVRSLLAGNDLVLNSPTPAGPGGPSSRGRAAAGSPADRLAEAATRVQALRIYQQRIASAAADPTRRGGRRRPARRAWATARRRWRRRAAGGRPRARGSRRTQRTSATTSARRGPGAGGSGSRHHPGGPPSSAGSSTPSRSSTAAATRACPSGARCSRSSCHSRRSCRAGTAPTSTTQRTGARRSRADAGVEPGEPGGQPRRGPAGAAGPLDHGEQQHLRRRRRAAPRRPVVPGQDRRDVAPGPEHVVRARRGTRPGPGASASATGTCSATTWSSSRPRTARFA